MTKEHARNEKGQFAKESTMTIEQKMNSFVIEGRDNDDYFGVTKKKFARYLSVADLQESRDNILSHLKTMSDFKDFLQSISSLDIKISDSEYTMRCKCGTTQLMVDVFNCRIQPNLQALEIDSNWETLQPTGRLAIIIEKLHGLVVIIDKRIDYLQSPA